MTRSLFSFPVILWVFAFICALYPYNPWQLELFGASITLIFIWSVASLNKDLSKGWQVPQSWAHRFMGAFWLIAFLSLFVSDVINVSLMAFCFFSVMPLSFYFFTLNRDAEVIRTIGYCLAVIFSVLAVWALIQFFFFNMENKGAAHHPLANSNSLGALFNLAIFSGMGWLLIARENKEKWVATFFTALTFGGLIATSSRGAFFSFLIFAPMMVIFLWPQIKANKQYVCAFITLAVGFFLSSLLGEFESNRIITRTVDTFTLSQPDITNNRLIIWEGALALLKEYQWLGIGIGMFFLHYNQYRLPEEIQGVYHAHSDPFQFWIELGILGPIFFYAFLVAVFIRTVKAFRASDDKSLPALLLAPFFGLSAVTLHAHVTFNFYNLSILYGCSLLLAVWFLVTEKILGESRKLVQLPKNTPKPAGILLISLPFLFTAFLVLPYLVSENRVIQARKDLIAGDLDAFAKNTQLSHKLSGYKNYRAHLLGVTVPLTLLETAQEQMDKKRLESTVKQALYYLDRASAINPRSAAALFYKGRLKELAPSEFMPVNFGTSEAYYKQALTLDPTHLGARMALADFWRTKGDKDAALSLLEQGYRYRYSKSNVIEYYQKIAIAFLEAGRIEDHSMAMQRYRGALKRFQVNQAIEDETSTPFGH
ncbi:MAG: O-antigen ligase family protein [Pseudomonadota bacterium]